MSAVINAGGLRAAPMGTVSVVIPTWKSARYLPGLVGALKEQRRKPDEILVVDSSSPDGSADLARKLGCRTLVIPKAEFNHGGTRTWAAKQATSDIVVFLSHDVEPVGDAFLGSLVAPIEDGTATAAYARQTAHDDAKPTEKFLRQYNYPTEGHVRSLDDVPRLGMDAFFFSNAASAVRRSAFLEVGGFPDDVILSEDMVLCARLLNAGHKVAYAPGAVVRHSHNYSLGQQFRRYFDIGVAYRDANALIQGGAKTSKGVGYATQQVKWFSRNGYRRWVPYGMAESAMKLAGYRLGRAHKRIPNKLRRKLSMHADYWDKKR